MEYHFLNAILGDIYAFWAIWEVFLVNAQDSFEESFSLLISINSHNSPQQSNLQLIGRTFCPIALICFNAEICSVLC